MGGLPPRDLWLLPLISIATLIVLLVGAEVGSRILWPEQLANRCSISDAALGVRYRPDCSAEMKSAEGPWYVTQYNDCGYRSASPCGPLAAGERRIALLGSSLGEGYLVEYPDTIGARLESDMTDLCGTLVQVQNLATLGGFGEPLLQRMDQAIALKPNAVVLVFAPFDLEAAIDGDSAPAATEARQGMLKRVFDRLKDSRALTIAQHFLFQNPSVYVPLYLRYGDKADFLRPPFTPKWQGRLAVLDRLLSELADRAHRAQIPLMVAFVPQEAEVALMASGSSVSQGVDPTALPRAVGEIAQRHKLLFTDTSGALARQHAPWELYYQVDGHLSGRGLPIVAADIAKNFALGSAPDFANCKQTSAERAEQPH